MLCGAFPGGRQSLFDAVTLGGFSVVEALEAVEAEVLRATEHGSPALETSRSLAPHGRTPVRSAPRRSSPLKKSRLIFRFSTRD